MFANARGEPFAAKIADDHPKLERAKTPPELDAVIRSAANLPLLRRAQVFRHQGKRAPQQIHPAAVKHRKIERREQPFVRVEHQRVCAVATIQNLAQLRHDCRRPGISRIHVQPQFVLLASLGDRRHGIDAGS